MPSQCSITLPSAYDVPVPPTRSWDTVFHRQSVTRLNPDNFMLRNGEPCQHLFLLLEGSIRVQKLSQSGHEIVLYHVCPGQICDLAAACILAEHHYPADAIAETSASLAMLPRSQFFHALETVPAFRDHIYHRVSFGVTRLVNLLEEVAFGPMDGRLAQRLMAFAHSSPMVRTTHQQLAVELGTAREVVSRLLKNFERHGWIKLHRGSVEIVNAVALRGIASRTEQAMPAD